MRRRHARLHALADALARHNEVALLAPHGDGKDDQPREARGC